MWHVNCVRSLKTHYGLKGSKGMKLFCDVIFISFLPFPFDITHPHKEVLALICLGLIKKHKLHFEQSLEFFFFFFSFCRKVRILLQGAKQGNGEWVSDPLHQVFIEKPFYIGCHMRLPCQNKLDITLSGNSQFRWSHLC